jgi:hypothetical protein
MSRSLKKGHASVYMQFAHVGHNIGAEKYECEVANGKAILRVSLRPTGENQRLDEEYLHNQKLVSLDVADSTVVKGLESYLTFGLKGVSSWELQILSRGKAFCFLVAPYIEQHSAGSTLNLRVLPGEG